MKKAKKVIPVILSLAVCLSLLAACNNTSSNNGSSNTGGGPVYQEELNVIIDLAPVPTIDVHDVASSQPGALWTFRMIYDFLVLPVGDGTYTPLLATRWETSDSKTFRFYLREDVTFQNGEKFTADDIVFTISKARDAAGTQVFQAWEDIDVINVIDPYTIEFTLFNVNVDFLFKISHPTAGIVNQKAMTDDPVNGSRVGTGPWTVTGFSTNDFIALTRNDNYWGDMPHTKKITLKFVPETSTRLMMLQNGEVDVSFSIDNVDLPMIMADTDNYTTFSMIMNNITMNAFNMDDPITGDWNFRMAVISTLDREEMTFAAMRGFGIAETEGTYWGSNAEFRNRSIPVIPYDMDKARDYLAASSYDGSTVEISFGLAPARVTAELIQQQLALIGVPTVINQMDSAGLAAYTMYGQNQSQIVCHLSPFTSSAASARHILYPGGMYNRSSYNNPEVTALLDQAATMTDVNQRRDIYYRVQELVAYDNPYVSMFFQNYVVACLKGVDGMILSPDNQHNLRNIYRIVG